MTTVLLFIGMGIGFTAAKLNNKGKVWQANCLLGTFLFGLVGYIVYSAVSIFID